MRCRTLYIIIQISSIKGEEIQDQDHCNWSNWVTFEYECECRMKSIMCFEWVVTLHNHWRMVSLLRFPHASRVLSSMIEGFPTWTGFLPWESGFPVSWHTTRWKYLHPQSAEVKVSPMSEKLTVHQLRERELRGARLIMHTLRERRRQKSQSRDEVTKNKATTTRWFATLRESVGRNTQIKYNRLLSYYHYKGIIHTNITCMHMHIQDSHEEKSEVK